MESPRSPSPQVTSCIHDRSPRRMVEALLVSRALRVAKTPWETLLDLSAAPRWQALIYDLCPWDGRALRVVAHVLERAPAAPVLLYPPHRPGVGILLEQCAGHPHVHVKLQFGDGKERVRLAAAIDRLWHAVPGEELRVLLRAGLFRVPDRAWAFIEEGLRLVTDPSGPECLHARSVAASMGMSVRTLERAFDHTQLPRPKELLNWLLLLYVTHWAERSQRPRADAARALNRSPNDIYRLQHRLLQRAHAGERRPIPEPSGRPFDSLLFTFLKRCGSHDRGRKPAILMAG